MAGLATFVWGRAKERQGHAAGHGKRPTLTLAVQVDLAVAPAAGVEVGAQPETFAGNFAPVRNAVPGPVWYGFPHI